jgi:hypothetical protein
MDWYRMNSNQSVCELHETSLDLRPDDLLGHWQARRTVSQDAVWNLKDNDYITPSGELAVVEAMELL